MKLDGIEIAYNEGYTEGFCDKLRLAALEEYEPAIPLSLKGARAAGRLKAALWAIDAIERFFLLRRKRMKLYGIWNGEWWWGGGKVWRTEDLRLAHAQHRQIVIGYDERGWQVREIGADGLPVPKTADEPLVEEDA